MAEKPCDAMETLLQEAPIVLENQSVRDAMEHLKGALESTGTMLQGIKADSIAAKLDQLKKLIGAVLATSVNMDENFAALLLPLERKVEGSVPLSISDSTHDASNDEETHKGKKGLIAYSWSDLEAAITSPDTKIGGRSSSIYKGVLNKRPVAIKEFHNFDEYIKEGFVHELNLASKLQHKHVVGLLGYCYEDNGSNLLQKGNGFEIEEKRHICFVTSYMLNQSLIPIIKGDKVVDFPCLFQIILGMARGLHHLHDERIVYLDLKPESILLDDDMTPKIYNFGKAKVLEDGKYEISLDEENLPGTGRYMAPEQSRAHTASAKSNVYSFGVILFEILSLVCASTSEQGPPKCFKDWMTIIMRNDELMGHIRNGDVQQYKRLMESTVRKQLDPDRVIDSSQFAKARQCVRVGLKCCSSDPAHRPSMLDVILLLLSAP